MSINCIRMCARLVLTGMASVALSSHIKEALAGDDSPVVTRLQSNNANVRADDHSTAINQLSTNEFVLNVKDYTVNIFNTQKFYAPKREQAELQRLRAMTAEIQTLMSSGYVDQADSQLASAFELFFRTPALVSSQAGQLTLTNLHILKAQRYEEKGEPSSAVNEYLQPLALLDKTRDLKKDYVRRIINKPVLLNTAAGVEFLISQRCRDSPGRKCPQLLAQKVKYEVAYLCDCSGSSAAVIRRLDDYMKYTALDQSLYPTIENYWPVLRSRLELVNYVAGVAREYEKSHVVERILAKTDKDAVIDLSLFYDRLSNDASALQLAYAGPSSQSSAMGATYLEIYESVTTANSIVYGRLIGKSVPESEYARRGSAIRQGARGSLHSASTGNVLEAIDAKTNACLSKYSACSLTNLPEKI